MRVVVEDAELTSRQSTEEVDELRETGEGRFVVDVAGDGAVVNERLASEN